MGQHTHRSSNTQFRQVRSHLFLFTNSGLMTHTELVGGVCLGNLSAMLIHLYIDCAFHFIPSTFKWSFSRHFMSFKPIPNTLYSATEHTLFPKLPPYICIPHKMFLHFRELLENGSLQRSPHKMFLHFMERLPNVCGLQCLQCLIVFVVFNVLNVFNVSSVLLSFWS